MAHPFILIIIIITTTITIYQLYRPITTFYSFPLLTFF